jgi:Flp pilus assembly protein TadD
LPGLRTRGAAGTGAQARAAADASFAFGQYGEAATLYQAALLKGGEDPNLVNTRLGAALALAGRRPEAELALRAVTGPRADLAGYWLVWLAHRPA